MSFALCQCWTLISFVCLLQELCSPFLNSYYKQFSLWKKLVPFCLSPTRTVSPFLQLLPLTIFPIKTCSLLFVSYKNLFLFALHKQDCFSLLTSHPPRTNLFFCSSPPTRTLLSFTRLKQELFFPSARIRLNVVIITHLMQEFFFSVSLPPKRTLLSFNRLIQGLVFSTARRLK